MYHPLNAIVPRTMPLPTKAGVWYALHEVCFVPMLFHRCCCLRALHGR